MGWGQGWWRGGGGTEVADVGAGDTPLTRRAGRVRAPWSRGLRPSRKRDACLDRSLMLGTAATVSQAPSVRNILCSPASLGVAPSGGADVRPGARGGSADRATILTVARGCSWPPQLLRQGGRVGPTVHLRPQLRPLHLHVPQPGPLGPGQPPRAHCLQSPPPVRVVRTWATLGQVGFQSLN